MNENSVEKCFCKSGFEKGAIKKSCEFTDFSIFGNLMKDNTIVIRYYGDLSKRTNSKILIHYTFNNNYTNIHEIILRPCSYDKNAYCASVELKDNMCITLSFLTENKNSQDVSSYSFKIADNTIDNIMKRYSFEPNEALPVVKQNAGSINKFYSIFNRIFKFFTIWQKN